MWDLHFATVPRMLGELRLNDGAVAETLQIAGEVAVESGETERALRCYEVGLSQWRALRRTDKVEQTEAKIAELTPP
jgi:hypothetical protein